MNTENKKSSTRRQRSSKRSSSKPADPYRELLKQFVVCSYCSYFLAGYRVLHGLQVLEEAAQASRDDWLTLSWDPPTRQLLYKSYGVLPESDMFRFEILCVGCQRRIIYEELSEDDPAQTFRLQFKRR